MAQTRSKEAIEAETTEAMRRLASNVEGLVTQIHPQAIKTRAVNDAKDFAAQEANSVRSTVIDDDGNPKWDQVFYLAVAVVGSIALLAVLRSLGKQ